MTHITKIAAIETTTAIWEYDPSLPDNRVLRGSLDIITAICTIMIKVCEVLFSMHLALTFPKIQASGQRLEYFDKLQVQCKYPEPLRILLHSNV